MASCFPFVLPYGFVPLSIFFFQAEDGIRDLIVTGVQTCALPISEALAKKVPKARVVSAFGTVPSEVLFDVFESRRKATRPSLVYCGDDPKSKKTAAELIRDVGFDPVDAGPLRIARYTEPFTLLIAQLALE